MEAAGTTVCAPGTASMPSVPDAENSRITIAFSTHRPETVRAADALMARSDLICLEEPPTPGFLDMLRGDLPIDAYLPETGTEYPVFTRQICRVLRVHFHRGATILQVEPYMERLLALQMRLADGDAPEDLLADSHFRDVYTAERSATGALIDFYEASAEADFDASVKTVIAFAEADAARFRLRDQMRAQELGSLIGRHQQVYVEAGTMHFYLIRQLARLRMGNRRIQSVHLQADESRRRTGRPALMAPGDRLTYREIFRDHEASEERKLMAARAIIYNRIIEHGELEDGAAGHPHLDDEIRCIGLVDALDMAACRALFPHVCRLSSRTARRMVTEFTQRFHQ